MKWNWYSNEAPAPPSSYGGFSLNPAQYKPAYEPEPAPMQISPGKAEKDDSWGSWLFDSFLPEYQKPNKPKDTGDQGSVFRRALAYGAGPLGGMIADKVKAPEPGNVAGNFSRALGYAGGPMAGGLMDLMGSSRIEDSTEARSSVPEKFMQSLAMAGGPLGGLSYGLTGGMENPYVSEGYEQVVRPAVSPAGIAITGATMGAGAIPGLAARTGAVGVSKFLQPAAKVAMKAAASPYGQAAINIGKIGLTGIGGLATAEMGKQTLENAGGLWENPTDEQLAKTLWSGAATAGAGFGTRAAYRSIRPGPIKIPPRTQLGESGVPSQIKWIQQTAEAAAEKVKLGQKLNDEEIQALTSVIARRKMPARPLGEKPPIAGQAAPFKVSEDEARAITGVRPYEPSSTGGGLTPAEIALRQKRGIPLTNDPDAEGLTAQFRDPSRTNVFRKRKGEPDLRPKRNIDQIIQTMMGGRNAAPLEGLRAQESLAAIDDIPTRSLAVRDNLSRTGNKPRIWGRANPPPAYNEFADKLARVQAGDPEYQPLRDYFDQAFRRSKNAGFLSNKQYRSNYLPQLWEQKPDEVAAVLGKRLSKKPTFSFERILEDYDEGIKKGLTPKFTKLSELAGWYEAELNKKIANNEAFNDLKKSGLIRASAAPRGREVVPKGMVRLDSSFFPTADKVKVKGKIYDRTYYAEPETARKLEAFFKQSGLKEAADVVSFGKNMYLAGGIPGTTLNRHTYNLMNRAFKQGGSSGVSEFIKAKRQDINLDELIPLVRAGMQTSAENKTLLSAGNELILDRLRKVPIVGNRAARFVELLERAYERPLFQEKIPAFKAERGKNISKEGVAAGLTKKEADARAASLVNTFFGGISRTPEGWFYNNKRIDTNDARELSKLTAIASDWMQTKYKVAGRELKSLAGMADPDYLKSLKRGTASTLARRGTAVAVGKGVFDQATEDQRPGTVPLREAFGQARNEKEKKYISFDPTGTSDELQRFGEMAVRGYARGNLGDIPRSMGINQLSLPLQSVLNLSRGENWQGDPFYRSKDRFGKPIGLPTNIARIVGELSQNITPPAANALIQLAAGDISIDEAIASGLELPVIYRFEQELGKSAGKKSLFGGSRSNKPKFRLK